MKRFFAILFFCTLANLAAQNKAINWLTFETLEKEILTNPKKTLVYFMADWYVFCKKMEQDVFTKPEIKAILDSTYYSVKFNVESEDTIRFGGKLFYNKNIKKKRIAYHEIVELLARPPNKLVTIPAILFFDETFTIQKKRFEYLPPKMFYKLLKT